MPLAAFETFVRYVRSQGWCAHTKQSGIGSVPQAKEGVSQRLIFGAGRAKSETGDDAHRVNSHEQMEPFVPAQTVAPADVGQASQPWPRRFALRTGTPVVSKASYGTGLALHQFHQL